MICKRFFRILMIELVQISRENGVELTAFIPDKQLSKTSTAIMVDQEIGVC